jgi:glycosyltransferase involved in cell wall biosynthesis
MAGNTPMVSVLMTAFNRERYVGQAMESVLASTMSDFELIVVDDCSSDHTVDRVEEYARRDSRIRLFVNEQNLGDYLNRNRAASYARGEYLKYVDSDDVIYPHGLDVMLRCMEAFPHAGLGLSALFDASVPYPQHLTPEEAYREHCLVRDLFGRAPGSAMIRRRAFEHVGGFSGRRQVGDYELWLTIARCFGVVKMPTDLIWSRQHGEQEKVYDSEVMKAVMHEEVLLAALHAKGCPLDESEREAAILRLKRNRARQFFWFMTQAGGPNAAREYRRRVGIPTSTLVSFTFNRLRRRSAPVVSHRPS